ncbi:hypothetical protein [Parvularcula sp. LCG005]|uniref:hypothetical protein n=1 Tax=Parvularcula sp. LCG005 TaxID=3078805 RepID=UPI00294263F7|nr:hypothetical protein [Parvularcula sp. LCG005]WOI52235.1 hypothetical protein RUI03_08725 [Parvularcula sp. LCG005]
MSAKKKDLSVRDRRVLQVKLVISLILDIVDGTIGRLFGFGVVTNMLLTVAAVLMFGWKGLFQLWEMIDPTHQIDGFVPTLTLIALSEWRRA